MEPAERITGKDQLKLFQLRILPHIVNDLPDRLADLCGVVRRITGRGKPGGLRKRPVHRIAHHGNSVTVFVQQFGKSADRRSGVMRPDSGNNHRKRAVGAFFPQTVTQTRQLLRKTDAPLAPLHDEIRIPD